MTEQVVIRRAVPNDFALVLDFHRDLYIRHRDEIASPDIIPLFAYRDLEQTLRDDVHGLLRGRDTLVLLAEIADQAMGYITGHIEEDERRVLRRKGVIEDWYVRKAQRGMGLGKQLMEAMTQHFRKAECVVVESGTWAFNEGARKAHAAAGFTEIEVKFRKRL